MAVASWLHWSERDALAERLEALADEHDTRHDFDIWRVGVLGAFLGGGVAFVGTPAGGWLLQGGEGLWAVIATVGELDAVDLTAVFQAIQAEARLVAWDEEAAPNWASVLGPFGARPYVRQTYVQALAQVAFQATPQDDLVLTPWDASPHQAGALELLAEANTGGLEGLFLTLPAPPTLAHCREALARVMAGAEGPVLPWASFIATDGEQIAGALLCIEGDHDRQGMLFDLYVAPAARGRQLSRRLVGAMQRALLTRGYTENQFLTMSANAPVHRLFRASEITDRDETRGGYWCRD